VDITLVDLRTGRKLDMGGHHDLLDVSSATVSSLITPKQQANRLKLRDAMAAAGMRNYSKEWWHYFLAEKGTLYSYNFAVRDDLLPTP
jgi:D-alanyl-D-alanine dipeptidase